MGNMYLVALDAHSKWPEVIEMTSTTAEKTIVELRRMFATYGLPEQVVTDNGPQFVADEFATFMKGNGIKHIRCAPYHPSSNGAVERFIQTFKRAMKAGEGDALPLSQRLANFLLSYRSTPHATTNRTPSELFLGRRVRTQFDLLRPHCDSKVDRKQGRQKADHDRHARSRELHIGQQVMARNLRPGVQWVAGVIVERLSPVTYLIQIDTGQLWKRHVDHLRVCGDRPWATKDPQSQGSEWSFTISPKQTSTPSETEHQLSTSGTPTVVSSGNQRRYPPREWHAPNRYM